MTTITEWDVANAMLRYGGTFIQALGKAYLVADGENREVIQITWAHYWKQYRELAEMKAAQERARG